MLVTSEGVAFAHRTGTAKSLVEVIDDKVIYRLAVSAHDLSIALGYETDLEALVPGERFAGPTSPLAGYLARRLLVTSDGLPCAMAEPKVFYPAGADSLEVEIPFDCGAPLQRLGIRYLLFFDIDQDHQGLGRIVVWGRGKERFLFDRTVNSFETVIER